MVVSSLTWNTPPKGTEVDAEYQTVRDKLAVKFAHQLAASLKEPDMRRFIREEVLQQFDGDYNFLLGTHLNKPVRITEPSGRVREVTFKEALFDPQPANARSSADDFLDSLQQYYPLLQIAVPELANASAETWDEENDLPLIAVIPRSTQGLEYILAYDSEGNEHQLPINEEPTEPIIVISENERLIGVPKEKNGRVDGLCPLSIDPYYSTPTKNYYFLNDYYEAQNLCSLGGGSSGGGGPGGGSAGGGTATCDRDIKNTKDELVKMKVNDYNDFKRINDWFDGGQEFIATIIMAKANGSVIQLQKAVTGKDGDFRDCSWFNCQTIWRNSGVEIVTWDKSIYGDTMVYDWIERDTGNSIEVSVDISTKINGTTVTATAKRTITDEDDILKSSAVEYCDAANGDGYLYNTGYVSFYVRQR